MDKRLVHLPMDMEWPIDKCLKHVSNYNHSSVWMDHLLLLVDLLDDLLENELAVL